MYITSVLTSVLRELRFYTLLLPTKALPRVTWSAYSKSAPTGKPDARRVTVIPLGLIRRERYVFVASPSTLGFKEDDLFDCFVFQTGEQLLNAQVCWADASHWVDGSAENMVQTVVFCRVLNSHDVTRVFNNADDAVVTARVLADSARADFGDVSADFTEANFFAQCGDGLGEVLHIVL